MKLLSELMACIQHAQSLRKNLAKVPYSSLSLAFLKILLQEGVILGYYSVPSSVHKIHVVLKYRGTLPVIKSISPVSTPGRKRYLNYRSLRKFQERPEILILSTTKSGLISHKTAFQNCIGGQWLSRIQI